MILTVSATATVGRTSVSSPAHVNKLKEPDLRTQRQLEHALTVAPGHKLSCASGYLSAYYSASFRNVTDVP